MKIAFALPCSGRYPIGGFRIVYEHANHLVEKGHSVTLIHATDSEFKTRTAVRKLKSVALFIRNKVSGLYKPRAWFALDKNVNATCCLLLDRLQFDRFDIAIATAWQTAEAVSNSNAHQKYYLIQHFEDWAGDADAVKASWALPSTKIVISQWLKQLLEAEGHDCVLVPNAIDTSFFSPVTPIEEREPSSVLVQLHPKDWKGSADALEAIRILRRRGMSITLRLFGIPDDRSFAVEGPYTYVRNPTQAALRDLYGNAAIFVAASWSEGWGLTPHEAAACGAAIVATAIDGHREFLKSEVSALLSQPKDPSALARNIERLLRDDALRVRIATDGLASARTFTWETTAKRFEQTLEDGWRRQP